MAPSAFHFVLAKVQYFFAIAKQNVQSPAPRWVQDLPWQLGLKIRPLARDQRYRLPQISSIAEPVPGFAMIEQDLDSIMRELQAPVPEPSPLVENLTTTHLEQHTVNHSETALEPWHPQLGPQQKPSDAHTLLLLMLFLAFMTWLSKFCCRRRSRPKLAMAPVMTLVDQPPENPNSNADLEHASDEPDTGKPDQIQPEMPSKEEILNAIVERYMEQAQMPTIEDIFTGIRQEIVAKNTVPRNQLLDAATAAISLNPEEIRQTMENATMMSLQQADISSSLKCALTAHLSSIFTGPIVVDLLAQALPVTFANTEIYNPLINEFLVKIKRDGTVTSYIRRFNELAETVDKIERCIQADLEDHKDQMWRVEIVAYESMMQKLEEVKNICRELEGSCPTIKLRIGERRSEADRLRREVRLYHRTRMLPHRLKTLPNSIDELLQSVIKLKSHACFRCNRAPEKASKSKDKREDADGKRNDGDNEENSNQHEPAAIRTLASESAEKLPEKDARPANSNKASKSPTDVNAEKDEQVKRALEEKNVVEAKQAKGLPAKEDAKSEAREEFQEERTASEVPAAPEAAEQQVAKVKEKEEAERLRDYKERLKVEHIRMEEREAAERLKAKELRLRQQAEAEKREKARRAQEQQKAAIEKVRRLQHAKENPHVRYLSQKGPSRPVPPNDKKEEDEKAKAGAEEETLKRQEEAAYQETKAADARASEIRSLQSRNTPFDVEKAEKAEAADQKVKAQLKALEEAKSTGQFKESDSTEERGKGYVSEDDDIYGTSSDAAQEAQQNATPQELPSHQSEGLRSSAPAGPKDGPKSPGGSHIEPVIVNVPVGQTASPSNAISQDSEPKGMESASTGLDGQQQYTTPDNDPSKAGSTPEPTAFSENPTSVMVATEEVQSILGPNNERKMESETDHHDKISVGPPYLDRDVTLAETGHQHPSSSDRAPDNMEIDKNPLTEATRSGALSTSSSSCSMDDLFEGEYSAEQLQEHRAVDLPANEGDAFSSMQQEANEEEYDPSKPYFNIPGLSLLRPEPLATQDSEMTEANAAKQAAGEEMDIDKTSRPHEEVGSSMNTGLGSAMGHPGPPRPDEDVDMGSGTIPLPSAPAPPRPDEDVDMGSGTTPLPSAPAPTDSAESRTSVVPEPAQSSSQVSLQQVENEGSGFQLSLPAPEAVTTPPSGPKSAPPSSADPPGSGLFGAPVLPHSSSFSGFAPAQTGIVKTRIKASNYRSAFADALDHLSSITPAVSTPEGPAALGSGDSHPNLDIVAKFTSGDEFHGEPTWHKATLAIDPRLLLISTSLQDAAAQNSPACVFSPASVLTSNPAPASNPFSVPGPASYPSLVRDPHSASGLASNPSPPVIPHSPYYPPGNPSPPFIPHPGYGPASNPLPPLIAHSPHHPPGNPSPPFIPHPSYGLASNPSPAFNPSPAYCPPGYTSSAQHSNLPGSSLAVPLASSFGTPQYGHPASGLNPQGYRPPPTNPPVAGGIPIIGFPPDDGSDSDEFGEKGLPEKDEIVNLIPDQGISLYDLRKHFGLRIPQEQSGEFSRRVSAVSTLRGRRLFRKPRRSTNEDLEKSKGGTSAQSTSNVASASTEARIVPTPPDSDLPLLENPKWLAPITPSEHDILAAIPAAGILWAEFLKIYPKNRVRYWTEFRELLERITCKKDGRLYKKVWRHDKTGCRDPECKATDKHDCFDDP